MKVYYCPAFDWLERDEEFGNQAIKNPETHWVRDKEKNILCVIGPGNHIGAVLFILKKFYGLKFVHEEELPKWREIVSKNMVFHNAWVNNPDHYTEYLPQWPKL